ncbi:MAG: GEVED domain-containing protein [Bacteroidota bacterium]
MKKILLLGSILLCFDPGTFSQITFQRVIGIDNQRQESGEKILHTADGGYLLAGFTFEDATSLTDAMIVKTDATGVPQWNRRFGTAAGSDQFASAFEDSNGDFYFAGTRENVGITHQDIYVVKTDASGTTLWEKIFRMPSQEYAEEIIDGGNGTAVIVTDAATVIKIDASGALLWQKVYDNAALTDIILTSDGGYALTGIHSSGFPMLIKTDADGLVSWTKTYGEYAGNETGKQIAEAPDGSFFIAITKSYIYPFDASENIVVLKTNSSGDQLWCNAYIHDNETIDLYDMTLTNGGGVVVCGMGTPFTGVAVEVNPDGSTAWDAKYGANESMTSDQVQAVIQTPDGGFAFTGSSYSFGTANSKDDFYLIKADASGETDGCFQVPINYNIAPQTFTTTTVAQTTSAGTFSDSLVSSSLAPAPLFTNIACSLTAGPVQADFTASPTSIIQGQTVDFTDLTSNFPTGWNWSFTGGSPASSSAQNPSGITYNNLGCFAVTLTASNANSTDTETKTCYINVIQDLSTSFQRSIGIDTLRQETGESIRQTADGGYLISGSTFDDATSLTDAMIVKTDASGVPQWHKKFGTDAGSDQFASSFQDVNGDLYFAGTRENVGITHQDIYVVKTDASGTTLWEKIFRMPSQEYALEITDGGNGTVVVVTDAGTVLKIDASGALLWQKLYDNAALTDITLTADGGYALTGIHGNGFPMLLKTDMDGLVSWVKTYGEFSGNETGKQVIEAPDGSFFVAIAKRYVYPFDASENIVLLKTSSTGEQLFYNAYIHDNETIDLFDMTLSDDGGVVICGEGAPYTGVAVKINPGGTVQWDAKYGAAQDLTADRVYAVIQTSDGGYAYTGSSYSFGTASSKDDFYLIKTDAFGKTGGCFESEINYNVSPQNSTETSVTQTTSPGTFSDSLVSSALDPVFLFTHLVCAPQVPGSYCGIMGSVYGTTEGDYIDGVQLGTISNLNSGSVTGPYYTDYTSTLSDTVTKESSYTISIKAGSWPVGYADRYAAWIDYNADADFDDPGEKLGEFLSSAPNATQSISFTVPAGAVTGETRLRVRGVWSGTSGIDPCDIYNYGETEDYTLVIEEAVIVDECPVTTSLSGTSHGDFINSVELESISNLSSGSAGGPVYTDYSASMTASLTQDSSYMLHIGSGSWATDSADYYAAWIDFNSDEDFDDAGEKIGEFLSTATNTVQHISFTVPASATPGETRMRVRGVYSAAGNLDPCTSYDFGETEDYKIIILTPVVTSYCEITASQYGTSEGDFIDGVALGSISNTGSGAVSGPFYTDYYFVHETEIVTENSFTLNITSGSWPEGYPDNYAAWIDYNTDGDFDDADEKLGEFQSTAPNTTQSISFTVPAMQSTTTRMRVRGAWGENLEPCQEYNYGETEDYKINISQYEGIGELSSGSFVVYPNPGTGLFLIHGPGLKASDIVILDPKGKQLQVSVTNSGMAFCIDLSSFSTGVYFVRIRENVQKIVKQ